MPPAIDLRSPQARHSIVLGVISTLFAVSCCVLTLTGWARGFAFALRGSQQATSAMEGPLALVIEAEAMARLTIQPARENRATALLVGAARSEGFLRFEAQPDGLYLRLPTDTREASLTVEVPLDSTLKVRLGTGTIEVNELRGAFDLALGEGRLLVRDHAARGTLAAQVARGELVVSLYSVDDDTYVSLQGESANITLDIPDGIGFAFEGETQGGTLSVGGVSITPREADEATASRLIGSATPERGRRISLRVTTGNIVLRAR